MILKNFENYSYTDYIIDNYYDSVEYPNYVKLYKFSIDDLTGSSDKKSKQFIVGSLYTKKNFVSTLIPSVKYCIYFIAN